MGNYKEESDEFDVDEPAELQENSDDEWAPAPKEKGKRSSTGSKRGAPAAKKKKTEEADDKPKKKASKAKTPTKSKPGPKTKTKQTKEEEKEDNSAGEEEEEEYTDEGEEEEEEADDNVITPKEFSSGAFIVRKTDYNTLDVPPLWRIDGKALLQKYMPEKKDSKTTYKNTSSYSGWNINNKDQFLPATVIFKQQTRKDHIVEFQRDTMPKIPCT